VAVPGACEPTHRESVVVGGEELRVFRCSWGWCVKRGGRAYRARTLLQAFEDMHGGPVAEPVLRDVVAVIERALEARHAQERRTVSTVVALTPPDRP
jgi:hypothetical protein